MNGSASDIAVIVPARNEAARITVCLTALLEQTISGARIIIVVNNSDDATAEIARNLAAQSGKPVDVLNMRLPPDQGVGTARRIGCAHAISSMSNVQYLLTTDADGVVAADWMACNLSHLSEVDCVCGKIDAIPGEAASLSGLDHHLAASEAEYRRLVLDWFHRFAPEAANPLPHHGEASGASLGFRIAAYLAADGFDDVKTGEDRAIVRRLKNRKFQVRHAEDVNVQVSVRLAGRAPGGMADALRDRLQDQRKRYLIDDALPAAEWLIRNVENPGIWPPQLDPGARLYVNDLGPHIALLTNFLKQSARPAADLYDPARNAKRV